VQGYSEQTARDIDAEVRRIVTDQYDRAKKILLQNQPVLNKIAESLLEYETIDSADIDVIMGGGTITRPPPIKSNVLHVPPAEKVKKPGLLDAIGGLPKPEPGKA
jgi:cell division protease FtsH